jgi:hypothetical protein
MPLIFMKVFTIVTVHLMIARDSREREIISLLRITSTK